MMKNTDTLVHTISAISLEPDDTAVTSNTRFETLCSYNWLKDGSAIVVPGMHCSVLKFQTQLIRSTGGAPRWKPRNLPVTLSLDRGYQLVDEDSFRVPKYPFEPVFQALSVENPNIRLDNVDVVANRNSLRKLLDFAAGRRQYPFRMDLHMVGNTLFVSRKEKSARAMINGSINSGYGHSFETVFTIPQTGLSRSSSHHRVVRYNLGCLDCVVRFEVDAYYETNQPEDIATAAEVRINDMATALANLSTGPLRGDVVTRGIARVIYKGKPMVPATLAELKVRKIERPNQAMPQLWFGRIPYLITGKHVTGVVHSISCVHAKQNFESWEKTNQETLRKLASLLKELKRVVHEVKGQTAIVVCQQRGAPLAIFSAKNNVAVLPTDTIERHWQHEKHVDNVL